MEIIQSNGNDGISKWLTIMVSLVTLTLVLLGLAYYHGQTTQHIMELDKYIENLSELEKATEKKLGTVEIKIERQIDTVIDKVDDIAQRVSHLEGRLQNNGYIDKD